MSDHDTADRALLSRVEAKQAAWRGEFKFIPTEWVWELAAALARRIAEGERLREAVLSLIPVNCDALHHNKRDRHEGSASCPVVARALALVAEEPPR